MEKFELSREKSLIDLVFATIDQRMDAMKPEKQRLLAEFRDCLNPALRKRLGAASYSKIAVQGKLDDSAIQGDA